ncbi:MAG: serine/threonine-protein kinase [Planctomycetota bacterium]
MAVPHLGQLALQRGLLDPAPLQELLERQRVLRGRGRFARLGELLVEKKVAPASAVRELLTAQLITLVDCATCGARYDAIRFQGAQPCLRCGQALAPAPADASLVVEDTFAEGPGAEAIVAGFHQRTGASLGPYRVLGEVGRGAMGVVLKAQDTRSGQVLALKLLLQAQDQTWEEQTRFRREASAIAAVAHPNVVRCYGLEEHAGLTVMLLEFIRGAPLDRLCGQGRLDRPALVRIAAQVGRALEAAHARGLVHRDVKPGNVIVEPTGTARLVDFGIAKSEDESVSLTMEDQVLGSLPYMAPEYVSQGVSGLDALCDVYALGVMLYATLSGGHYPYGDPKDDEGYVVRLVSDEPTPLAKAAPGLEPQVAAVVQRAIAKDRAQRYPSAGALAIDLEALLS